MAKGRKPKTKRKPAGHDKPEDDAALWRAFAKNINPLGLKGRVPDNDSALFKSEIGSEPSERAPGTSNLNSKPANAPRHKMMKQAPAPPEPKSISQQNVIEPREVRRLGSGRNSVDARIDLHGMRQSEAYAALKVFLFRSVAKGHRMVLVITGKGSASYVVDGQEQFGAFINEGARERGVLRRNVPLWLTQPELRAIVVGHTTAHIRHGGEGALYVQLRRSRQA